MNLGALESGLRTAIGNPSLASVSNATLDIYINRAYREIVDKYRFRAARTTQTFATVANTASYNLSPTPTVVMRVKDTTNGIRIMPKTDFWLADQGVSTSTGKPLYYLRYASGATQSVTLSPTPDDVYNIEVYYKFDVTDLTGSASPIIPTTWHDGILKLARVHYFDDFGDYPKAQYALAIWQGWIRDKPSELDEELFVDSDIGVSVPTLSQSSPRLDFDHSP